MKVNYKVVATILLLFASSLSARASSLSPVGMTHSLPEEGKEYRKLAAPLASQPKVVEFFSFYCGPCYQFVENYPVAEAINGFLPENEKVVKYHVSAMGSLGSELTEAWAIAMVMGKTHELEKPLFEAVGNKRLNTITDIQDVFAKFGIDTSAYEQACQSTQVKDVIARQNDALGSFAVRGTPSFYINGKYQINNASITATTPQSYVAHFAEVVQILLTQ